MAENKHRFLLLPIRELSPHEEARAERVTSVALSILRLRRVLRPVIVEEKTLTIIDGHHRYNALRVLGARYAPVVLARYGDGIAAIRPPRRRLLVRAESPEEALAVAAEHIEARSTRGSARLVLRAQGKTLTINRDLDTMHRAIGELEEKILGRGARLYHVAVEPEPVTPSLILGSALRGEPYPPKTSIHVTGLKRIRVPTRLSKLL